MKHLLLSSDNTIPQAVLIIKIVYQTEGTYKKKNQSPLLGLYV